MLGLSRCLVLAHKWEPACTEGSGAGDGLEPLGRELGSLVLGAPQKDPGTWELLPIFKGSKGDLRAGTCEMMTRAKEPSSKSHVVLIRRKESDQSSRTKVPVFVLQVSLGSRLK